MAEDPRFLLHFKTKAKFEEKLADGTINPDRHLCFIKDLKLIWCRGLYYTDFTKLEGISSLYNNWSITLSNASNITITLSGIQWDEEDRTWNTINKSLNLVPASRTVAGLLSSADKTKLDGLNTNNVSNIAFGSDANNVTVTISKDNGVSTDTSTTVNIPAASSTSAGTMSSSDKTKIDNLFNGVSSDYDTLKEIEDKIKLNINNIDIILGDGEGSINNAIEIAKDYTDSAILNASLTVLTVTSLSNVPATTLVIIINVSSSGTLTFTLLPSSNKEIHILIVNKGSSTITITQSSNYIIGGDETFDIDAGKYGEVNCLVVNGLVYVRGIGS